MIIRTFNLKPSLTVLVKRMKLVMHFSLVCVDAIANFLGCKAWDRIVIYFSFV